MKNIDDLSVKKVVILGSKPGATLPKIDAQVVIGANSAIELGVAYRENFGSRLVSMVPCNHFGDKIYIQDSVRKSCPEEVIVLGECLTGVEELVAQTLNLKDTEITIFSARYINWTLLGQIGMGRYFVLLTKMIRRNPKYFLLDFWKDLLGLGRMDLLARSTGVNAILYALSKYKNLEHIVIAGVGLEAGGHFNGLGSFTEKTALSDRIVFKFWSSEKRSILKSTDTQLCEIGGISKWDNDILS